MIYIYLAFIIIIYLSIRYRKMDNPYKLYMIFGKKGSGKSTYLCKLAMKYLKKKYIVYTNMQDMNIPNVRIINAEKLGEFIPEPHSCVLLDEVGMLYDNRDYKNFKPAVRDFFKLQRHYKCVVYLASQTFDIDKKLRDLTDRMFLITRITNYLSLIRPISKKIVLVEASSQGESRISENLRFLFITSYRFNFIPKYVKYFDSFIAPNRDFIEYQNIDKEDYNSMENTKSICTRARMVLRACVQKIKNIIKTLSKKER